MRVDYPKRGPKTRVLDNFNLKENKMTTHKQIQLTVQIVRQLAENRSGIPIYLEVIYPTKFGRNSLIENIEH